MVASCNHKDARLMSPVVVKAFDSTAGAVKAWQKITKITWTLPIASKALTPSLARFGRAAHHRAFITL